MPCYSPLYALAVPTVEGKKQMHIFKGGRPSSEVIAENKHIGEVVQLPCGQCLGCRLEYSRQWATRCALEAKQWSHNYFVTLTYDPEHVPVREHFKVNEDTGEVMMEDISLTLQPKDLQKFIKRLRTNFKREYGHTGIRFFACGEYGSKTQRPHYHLILFNCPFQDLVLDKAVDGFCYYRSAMLEKTWPFGMSLVSDFTYQTAAYVARYMLKKHKGKDGKYYEQHGIEPEFTRSSRRPGLARDYYDENKEKIYEFDNLFVSIGNGKVLQTTPPKYFDRCFEVDDPERMQELKEKRKDKAERTTSARLESTSLGLENYLKVCENNKSLSISRLTRSLE